MSKRARHAPNTKGPFNYELISIEKNGSKYSVTAAFSIPGTDEECPLTLDLISESKLSFLPDTPFLLDRPEHSKLTLPCGHVFSAMTLIYNFCKNSMVCPCCRAGKEVRANVSCLPRHLRADIKAQIQRIRWQEERDEDDAIIRDLISATGFVSVIPYSVLASNDNLSLTMEFYNTSSSLPLSVASQPLFSMTTPLHASLNLPCLEPRSDLRAISNITHMGVNAVRLSITLTMRGTGRVAIDATTITPLPAANDENAQRRLVIPGITSMATTEHNGYEVIIQLRGAESTDGRNGPPTSFCIEFAQSTAFPCLTIRNIKWYPGTETLAIMSNNLGFGAMM